MLLEHAHDAFKSDELAFASAFLVSAVCYFIIILSFYFSFFPQRLEKGIRITLACPSVIVFFWWLITHYASL